MAIQYKYQANWGGNKQMIKRDLKVEFKTSCKQNFESL